MHVKCLVVLAGLLLMGRVVLFAGESAKADSLKSKHNSKTSYTGLGETGATKLEDDSGTDKKGSKAAKSAETKKKAKEAEKPKKAAPEKPAAKAKPAPAQEPREQPVAREQAETKPAAAAPEAEPKREKSQPVIEDKIVTLDQVPVAVKTTLDKVIADGTIKEIKHTSMDGKPVYHVKIEAKGDYGDVQLKIEEDGFLTEKSERFLKKE